MFIRCVIAITFALFTEPKVGYAESGDSPSKSIDCDSNELRYAKETLEESEDWLRMDLTDFVDYSLPLISKFMLENDLDPLAIPDRRRNFWTLYPFLPTTPAEFTYYLFSGSIEYLSELERNGTVIVAYRDKTFTIDATIAFDSVLLTCDYFVKLLFLWQRGSMRAEVTSIWVNVVVDFDIVARKLALNRLKLNGIESIKVSVYGSNLIEPLLTLFGNVATILFKQALSDQMEKDATTMARGYVEWINDNVFSWNIF